MDNMNDMYEEYYIAAMLVYDEDDDQYEDQIMLGTYNSEEDARDRIRLERDNIKSKAYCHKNNFPVDGYYEFAIFKCEFQVSDIVRML